MFSLFKLTNLSPAEVKAGLENDEVLLIDVREADEHAAEAIPGAVNIPLSRLTAEGLPELKGRKLVTHCAGGVRSKKAAEQLFSKGVKVEHHLQGGINAWKAHGLPTRRP